MQKGHENHVHMRMRMRMRMKLITVSVSCTPPACLLLQQSIVYPHPPDNQMACVTGGAATAQYAIHQAPNMLQPGCSPEFAVFHNPDHSRPGRCGVGTALLAVAAKGHLQAL